MICNECRCLAAELDSMAAHLESARNLLRELPAENERLRARVSELERLAMAVVNDAVPDEPEGNTYMVPWRKIVALSAAFDAISKGEKP